MNNLKLQLEARGWSKEESEKIASDLSEIIPELVKSEEGFSIRGFGKLFSIVKNKPEHLQKVGTHKRTFKVKFTQSRKLQKEFVKSESQSLRIS